MRMLFGFAVLSMLMTPALSAEPQVKLPAKMIGTWCISENAASGGASTIYHRSKNSKTSPAREFAHVERGWIDQKYLKNCDLSKLETVPWCE